MKAISFVFALILCISLGYCHDHKSCYYCRSKNGWDDCSSKMEEITCSAEEDACAKLYFEGKLNYTDIKGYVKDCSVKSACNQDLCKTLLPSGATFNKCDVHCCEGDLCNAATAGATVTLVSAFLILLAFF